MRPSKHRLAALGAPQAAERVGWEALRRYPENPQWRTQLATLLDRDLGRSDEAERLLRETLTLFPRDQAARPQLATLLAEMLDRPEEAAALLREAIEVLPDDRVNYIQLAMLLADRLSDWPGAVEAGRGAPRLEPDNEVTRRLVVRLQAGVRSRIQPRQAPLGLTASKPLDLGVDLTAGRARRALFLAETATDAGRAAALAELDRVLADDPTLAYARYAAQRAGVHVPGARPDTTFAFAFAQAAREGATAAFEALAQHVFGMERYVARAGITLLSDAVTFATPPGANDLEPAALARRFTVLTGEITTALRGPSADRRIFLRLLGDFAAADLSSGIVA